MLKYIAQTVEEETKTGIKYMRVDIIVDSADELVTSDGAFRFTFGSRAWVVNARTFYGLNSSGTWVNQKDGE